MKHHLGILFSGSLYCLDFQYVFVLDLKTIKHT